MGERVAAGLRSVRRLLRWLMAPVERDDPKPWTCPRCGGPVDLPWTRLPPRLRLYAGGRPSTLEIEAQCPQKHPRPYISGPEIAP